MNRFKSDYSSRFRILKGGKISLVVSALLVGAISVSEVKAGTVNTAITANYDFGNGDSEDLLIDSSGSIAFCMIVK